MAKSFLIYADTGVGKTSTLIGLAKWIYERTGKISRIITNDLGGIGPIEREGLIEAGIVSVHKCAGDSPKTLANWRKLSRGWWPTVEVEMVPQLDSEGIIIGDPIQKKVRKLRAAPELLKNVGLTFVENLTTISEQLMGHLVKQEVIAEDGKVSSIGPQGSSGRYEEDGEVVGGNSKGHYNIVQVEVRQLVSNFHTLPDPMLVGWTAYVGKGMIKRTGESCYVPQLAGEAKNHLVPGWVGDCFHLQDIPEIRGSDGEIIRSKEVRAYFTNHVDQAGGIDIGEGIQYKAKSRMGLSDIHLLEERFPGGFIPLGVEKGQGLDQYFRWIDERGDSNLVGLMDWKKKIDEGRKK